jgi:hypothetical protein
MSALFGAAVLAGIYAWAIQLFDSRPAALWATALSFINQMLYVQCKPPPRAAFRSGFISPSLI